MGPAAGAPRGMGGGGFRRYRSTLLGHRRLRGCGGRGWQRLHRRILRRPGFRGSRRPSRSCGAGVPRAEQWSPVPARLACVRRDRDPDQVRPGGRGRRGVRRAQPDRRTDDSGGTCGDRLRSRSRHGAVRRLVRSTWACFAGLRPSRPRSVGPGCRRRGHRRRGDRVPERAGARLQRGPVGGALRASRRCPGCLRSPKRCRRG